MTRTTFCTPSLADGRDLLYQIIPKTEGSDEEGEWKPSTSLFELIQHIPKFIENLMETLMTDDMGGARPMIGRFYLGLDYDYQQVWMQNQMSSANKDSRAKDSGVAIYPCS